jgi:hypothetical protein
MIGAARQRKLLIHVAVVAIRAAEPVGFDRNRTGDPASKQRTECRLQPRSADTTQGVRTEDSAQPVSC